MENRYKINYDIKQRCVTNAKFKQGDIDSSILDVTLFDNGTVIDITGEAIEFRFLKPDNTVVFQDSTSGVSILNAAQGQIQCILRAQTLAVSGQVKCEIHRTKDGKELTTPSFYFTVDASIGADGVISTNYISSIEQKIIEANTAVANANTATTLANTATTNANTATQQIHDNSLIIYKPMVTTFADIAIQYPTPDNGWCVQVQDTHTKYRYNGIQWLPIGAYQDDHIGDMGLVPEGNLAGAIANIRQDKNSTLTSSASVISLPNSVGGQLNFSMKGRTLKNELTYNPSTWAEWIKHTGVIGDSTGLEFTVDGTNNTEAVINVNLKSSTKYGLLYNVVSSNLDGSFVSASSGGLYPLAVSSLPKSVGYNKIVVTSISSILSANNKIDLYANNANTFGTKIKIKDICIYELPTGSQIESDFTNLTADQLNAKYPFASGISSVGETESNKIEVLSRGKNEYGANEFYNELYAINSSNVLKTIKDGRNCIRIVTHSTYYLNIYNNKKFKPNTQYTIKLEYFHESLTIGGTALYFLYSDGTSSNIGMNMLNTWTFVTYTSTIGKSIIGIKYAYGTNTTPTYINADTMQIEEGTAAATYEPYHDDIVSNQFTAPLRGLLSAQDIANIDGTVDRNIGKIVYTGADDEGWTLYQTGTDYISFISTTADIKLASELLPDNKFNVGDYDAVRLATVEGIVSKQVTNGVCISIAKSKLATANLAGFLTWLGSNNTTVYYVKATATQETISKPVLESFKDGSLVINTVIPPETTATYPINVTGAINSNADNIKMLNDFMRTQNALNLTFDTRLVALESK